MPRMLNKGLTRSMQSLSRTQNWARERTASSSRFPIWRRHIGKHEDPGDDVVSLLRIFFVGLTSLLGPHDRDRKRFDRAE